MRNLIARYFIRHKFLFTVYMSKHQMLLYILRY